VVPELRTGGAPAVSLAPVTEQLVQLGFVGGGEVRAQQVRLVVAERVPDFVEHGDGRQENSAEVPGWTSLRTESMRSSSMPTSSSAPPIAPTAAPTAMPNNGMKNRRPNRSPQNAPPSAASPAEMVQLYELVLGARRPLRLVEPPDGEGRHHRPPVAIRRSANIVVAVPAARVTPSGAIGLRNQSPSARCARAAAIAWSIVP